MAFKEAKAQLTSPCLLAHFDPEKKPILSCDASPYGIGAVLSHQFEDGVEKPIAYASNYYMPLIIIILQRRRNTLTLRKKVWQSLMG